MAEINDLVYAEVEKFNQSIIDSLDEKGINDTGRAKRSIRIDAEPNVIKSLGVFYLEFLDTGRGPGNAPPFNRILQWAMRKIGTTIPSEAWGLARYVTNKIAQFGTNIFQNNSDGIELDEKLRVLKQNINDQIAGATKIEIERHLNKFTKKWKNKHINI